MLFRSLTNYIVSFSDNGLALKSFVNEELKYLKHELNQKLSEGSDGSGQTINENIQKVLSTLEDFKRKPLDEKMVKKLFYIQDLVGEL